MSFADFYRAAGLLALQMAERKGLDKQQARRIEQLLRIEESGKPAGGSVAQDDEAKATKGP
jgi:hypothetical protein